MQGWDGASPIIHYPDGTSKKVVRDPVGNVISVFENDQETISYSYLSNGNPEIITAQGAATSFSYDIYG